MARGRKKGSKNIKREGDQLVNFHGVEFSESDKRQLESLVNSANRKRRRMLKAEGDLERVIAGRATGQTIAESVGRMGKESDFVLAKKTKSLNRFRTRKDFDRYIDNLQRVVKRDYVENRIKQYKENHAKAIRDAYGDQAKDILETLENMTIKEYAKAVQSDEVLEIGFVYIPSEKDRKFARLERAFKPYDKDGEGDNAKNNGRLRNNKSRRKRSS